MKTISGLIEVTAMDDDGVFRGGTFDDLSELKEAITEGRAYKEGNLLLQENYAGGEFHVIKDTFISSNARSKLKGSFLVDNNDEVYYIADKKLKGNSDIGDSGKLPDGCVLAKDKDFEWVEDEDWGYIATNESNKGYYKYIGSDKCVEIPHTINGNPMTSYYSLFEETNVEKVISTNPNVTSMAFMFYENSATSLDLSSLDTSNVTDMSDMFAYSKATSLDLSSLDTSNVTNMNTMFFVSSATSLDLSSFDTNNVTDMSGMFFKSSATSLDLSSFDTSNVTDMNGMFYESYATTLDLSSFNTSKVADMHEMFFNSSARTGYAKSEEDAEKFNNLPWIPASLTFIVKP